ncbi:MAG: DEAD/DEAH box helicase [Pseudomonadota bacterium]
MKQALSDALAARDYTSLTPVQEAVSKPELEGADMLVSAQTGSGKTVGFGLAIAPTVLDGERFEAAGAPLALIVAPTRELAMQVKRELAWLYAEAGVVMASCVGGMDMRDERRALERGAHIVVATPGRLRDHIMRGSIDLSGVRAVVLDEADEMLDLGFREDLEFILGEAPEERQTLLFSATVPRAIAKLAERYQRDAVRVETVSGASQHADIEYRAMAVSARDGENAIINVLRYFEAPNAIVFCNTRAMVNRLTTRLSNRGFPVVALSGELTQSERTHALQAMRDGRARVCVATDVAARGIDLPNLDLVVHAELPSSHETLLHRSGRTGRAGRKGVSVLVVPPAARKKAERILHFAKLQAEWGEAPSADEVKARDEARMVEDPAWLEEIPGSDIGAVNMLVGRFAPEQIAAAYLRLYRAHHSAPEELSPVDAKPAPRKAFGPSVWFSVAGGRAAGAEPRRLLPMLCKAGGLTKEDIGAIRVQQDVSYVELREGAVDGFLSELGEAMTVEDGAAVTRLEKAPDLGPSGGKPGRFKGKPRVGKREYGDKPRGPKRENDDKPRKPRAEKTDGTTVPVDWNDAPTPRVKKPKGAPKGGAPKSRSKERREYDGAVAPKRRAEGDAPKRRSFDDKPKRRADGDGKPKRTFEGEGKPKRRSDAADPSKRFERPGKKGPPPPKGKPNSKKNRARAAAAKGGNSVPKRRG